MVNKGNGTAGMVRVDSNVTELSPSGTVIGTYVAGSYPEIVAIDSAGNVWVTNGYGTGNTGMGLANSSITELSPSGTIIGTYATGILTLQASPSTNAGNVWVTNFGNGTVGTTLKDSNVQKYMGAAKGPQYFPYSGPQWPGAE